MSYREIRIIDCMIEHGDAFERGIASLYSVATAPQRQRVREAFRPEWECYEKLAEETPPEPHP
jgi:hypothetical protein